MTAWLYALALKMVAAPFLVFAYWLVAIKGGNSLCRLIPDGKLKRALLKERTF